MKKRTMINKKYHKNTMLKDKKCMLNMVNLVRIQIQINKVGIDLNFVIIVFWIFIDFMDKLSS